MPRREPLPLPRLRPTVLVMVFFGALAVFALRTGSPVSASPVDPPLPSLPTVPTLPAVTAPTIPSVPTVPDVRSIPSTPFVERTPLGLARFPQSARSTTVVPTVTRSRGAARRDTIRMARLHDIGPTSVLRVARGLTALLALVLAAVSFLAFETVTSRRNPRVVMAPVDRREAELEFE